MSDTLAVMPTYMRKEDDLLLTLRAIESLKETSDADLLVVDDGSPVWELQAELAKRSGTDFQVHIKHENEGFARTVNVGLKRAAVLEKHALLVNADVEFFNNGWLDHLRSNDADVVGSLLIYPNGTVQHAGIYYSVIMRWFDHMYRMAPRSLAQVHEPRICPVTAALQLIKFETLKKIGLYDENFRMGYEDVDYCHQVFKAGMKCAYEPKAEAIHYESMFRGVNPSDQIREWSKESWEYLHEKHRGHDFSEYVPTMLDW